MKIEWDKNKEQTNIEKHGFSFKLAKYLFESDVVWWVDDRKDYGETRCSALSMYQDICFNFVFTIRNKCFRIISLRRANKREQRRYKQRIRNRSKYER